MTIHKKELLNAGVHFGHPKSQWNPKMAPYIFGEKNNVYIIDLQKTAKKCAEAADFVRNLVAAGGSILFVGTKWQAQAVLEEGAKQCGMFYVNQRWLGGMLTNFVAIRNSVARLCKLDADSQDGAYDRLPKKEVARLEKERKQLEKYLSGVRAMAHLPDAVFIVDVVKERICVKEALRLKIPIIAIVDTDGDPDPIDYVIPGNDDGTRAVCLLTRSIVEAALEGIARREPPAVAAAAPPLEENRVEH